jgi:hypothetical protein
MIENMNKSSESESQDISEISESEYRAIKWKSEVTREV